MKSERSVLVSSRRVISTRTTLLLGSTTTPLGGQSNLGLIEGGGGVTAFSRAVAVRDCMRCVSSVHTMSIATTLSAPRGTMISAHADS
jgi:hypothetical protein